MAAKSKKSTNSRKKSGSSASTNEQHSALREVVGVSLIGAGLILTYFALIDSASAMGAGVRAVLQGLAGVLFFVVPILLAWAGIMVIFSSGSRRPRMSHVLLVSALPLLLCALIHTFFADRIMSGMRLYSLANFFARSYDYQQGGAGVLGALICWPVYHTLMRDNAVGAAMVLIVLTVADLVLLRKISITKLGRDVQAKYAVYREHAVQRADERRVERERRAEERAQAEMEVPRFSGPAPRAHRGRAVEVPSEPMADELDFPDPVVQSAREMKIERISLDQPQPLPGEPRVAQAAEEEFEEDIPHFLVAKRPKRKPKMEKLHVAEPQPLYLPESEPASDEPVAPEPDGSEIAEPEPHRRAEAGEAAFDWDARDWQEISLGDEVIEAPGVQTEPEAPSEPDDAPPFDVSAPVAPRASLPRKRLPRAMPVPREEAPPSQPAQPAGKPFDRLSVSSALPEDEPYSYPPIDLLTPSQPSKVKGRESQDELKAKKLVETLASFGISARLIGIAHGPTVTRFELSPAAGVKVSRITALADDIALNLAAVSVRIEAPIPGKAAVGVEVPNDSVEVVPLRDVLESPDARKHPSRLAVALGRDNAGRYIVADLAKMPHVLIAGATGSGKSVCINCIICSILYRATPDEVRLIMIDPKVVELSSYNGIPHLLVPVVTDPKKAASALDWAVNEMTQRYKKFAERGVRDMKGYNQHRAADEPAMPQIVIIIDELADLMMVTPGEVEDSICRLAQLARAAGIHLVIATQRPSVNVITGVIKANIPSRIAFTVASQVDSRTILDMGGAEKLLGRGDMLFAPAGANKPARVQGAWVSDDEVNEVVEYIKTRHESTYDEDILEHLENAEMSDAEREDARDEYDELLPQAVEIVVEAGQASTSMLQRRLRVGYARAGRLIDEMEQRGIIGQADGAKPRNVLISREQFKAMF